MISGHLGSNCISVRASTGREVEYQIYIGTGLAWFSVVLAQSILPIPENRDCKQYQGMIPNDYRFF